MNKKSSERYMRAYKRYFYSNDIVLKKISEISVEDIEELFRDILRRFNDVSEKELELVRIILNQTFKHALKVGACKENMYTKFKKTTLITINFVYVDVDEESEAAYEK